MRESFPLTQDNIMVVGLTLYLICGLYCACLVWLDTPTAEKTTVNLLLTIIVWLLIWPLIAIWAAVCIIMLDDHQ